MPRIRIQSIGMPRIRTQCTHELAQTYMHSYAMHLQSLRKCICTIHVSALHSYGIHLHELNAFAQPQRTSADIMHSHGRNALAQTQRTRTEASHSHETYSRHASSQRTRTQRNAIACHTPARNAFARSAFVAPQCEYLHAHNALSRNAFAARNANICTHTMHSHAHNTLAYDAIVCAYSCARPHSHRCIRTIVFIQAFPAMSPHARLSTHAFACVGTCHRSSSHGECDIESVIVSCRM